MYKMDSLTVFSKDIPLDVMIKEETENIEYLKNDFSGDESMDMVSRKDTDLNTEYLDPFIPAVFIKVETEKELIYEDGIRKGTELDMFICYHCRRSWMSLNDLKYHIKTDHNMTKSDIEDDPTVISDDSDDDPDFLVSSSDDSEEEQEVQGIPDSSTGLPMDISEDAPANSTSAGESVRVNEWENPSDDEILEEMVMQTNLFADQTLQNNTNLPRASRLKSWTPTNLQEMKKFLGSIGYMGIVSLPSIRDYWSKKKLFQASVLSQVMSRNRFELLLTFWHFSDNCQNPGNDRGYKINPFLRKIITKFQAAFTPGEVFCINETLVPFRGRLIMRQYIPQKVHKYGIKLFRLCSNNGYTWNLQLYCGKEQDKGSSVPTKVVLSLANDLLGQGRTVVTDNYYTSLELANKLLDKNSHLL